MRHHLLGAIALTLATLPFLGCNADTATDSEEVVPQALGRFASSDWSEPQPIGPPVNTTASEQNATLAKDELTLYFTSDRTDGRGAFDIWISKRATTDDPWGAPENLQAINTTSADFAPNLSTDGHLLFFASNRQGSNDIYVSRRANPNDDQGWGPPTRLGSGVNTADAENAPMYLQSAEDGSVNLYFNRGVLTAGQGDIYQAAITRDGETLGPAVRVDELSVPAPVNDAAVSIRADGREIFFWSTRGGNQDLWTSTRQSVHHPWSEPTRLDAPLNSAAGDLTPSLTHDARTLVFASSRAPSLGGNDLWITTRTPSGK